MSPSIAERTEYNRKWRAANPDKVAAWRPAQNLKQNALYLQQHKDLIAALGGKCQCPHCDIAIVGFLTIEHLDGLPQEHRTTSGKRKGTRHIVNILWNELQRTGKINPSITVHCFNCNSGRAANKGICPHEEVMPNVRPVLSVA